MKLSDVRGLRVIVWGGAREGYSAAEICLRQNCQVAIVSDTPDSDVDAQRSAQSLDVSLLGVHQIPEWNPDFIIRSPGVSRYREELANGYHELLNPDELAKRARIANEQRIADGKFPLPEENPLIEAMRIGFPSCCGCALGFDRVVMLACNATSLREVIPFPADLA